MKSDKRNSVSRIALGLAASLMMAHTAAAQDTDTTDTDEGTTEVIVVGARKALQSAQAIKRNSDTVVDSITATDIGAFPDKSVAEALQRVPGVTVLRSAARNDVMHYSAEPAGVIVRGLPQVRSEFNGRDMFSATSGYGLSWSDISPEMMAGIDTYKNQTAELIEGGIAGSINLRTRVPFDQRGQLISGTVEANYGDLSKRTTPNVSALYSNRWDTELGEFGLLLNGAYSEVKTTSEAVTLPRMVEFVPGTYTDETNYIPSGIAFNDTLYDRKREGLSVAGQWQNNDRNMKATLQYNRSSYDNTWTEDQLISYWMWVDPATTNHSTTWNDPTLLAPPVGGDAYQFGADGMFNTGVITGSRGGWGYGLVDWDTLEYIPGSTDQYGTYAKHGINLPLIQPCLNLTGVNPCRAAPVLNTVTRYSNEVRTIDDVALNFVWSPTDKLRLNFDLQHVKATTEKYDVTFEFTTYADLQLDLTGEYPRLGFQAPSGYNVIGSDPLSDYRNYSPESAMDHRTDSEGTLTALRLDAAYDFDGNWLDELRGGIRFADREQNHYWSAYNWGSISSDWGVNPADSWFLDSGPTYNTDGTIKFQGYEPGYYENRAFGNDLMGENLLGHNNFVFMNRDVISNAAELSKRFGINGQTDEGGTASSAWNPICERPEEVANSCFTAGERLSVSEDVKSAYIMLKFGGPDAVVFDRFRVSGNVGVRYVETTVESAGALNFADPFTPDQLVCNPLPQEVIDALDPDQYAISPGCLALGSLQDQAFSSGGSTPSVVRTKHKNTLPSLNLKVDLSDQWLVRFAASRAMSKPDIGLLRNFTTLNRSFVPQTDIRVGNPNIVLDGSGNPVGYNYTYSGATGNPRLKPVVADQFDLSIENYFDNAGSFSFAVFHKKFHDYIQNGVFTVPITNEGVTRDVTIRGPVNGDGAKISGFEVAYQRYFDFLPAPWDGLGIQANYTKLDNSGVTNSNLEVDTTGGDAVAASAQEGNIIPARLENLSDDAYNLILMYEKGKFGGRLAYNWRSEYISSINDCCVRFHVWNEEEGFLDGSLRYAINDNIELNAQASNLLGTEIRIRQQVKGPTAANPDQAMKFLPAGWFRYDRRFQLGVRFKF